MGQPDFPVEERMGVSGRAPRSAPTPPDILVRGGGRAGDVGASVAALLGQARKEIEGGRRSRGGETEDAQREEGERGDEEEEERRTNRRGGREENWDREGRG